MPITDKIQIHEIEVDGLPNMAELLGRVAFIFDGCLVSGWPLTNGNWKANSDVGRDREFAGVTHWIEIKRPIWSYGVPNQT